MYKEVTFKEWLTALKSGEYKQGYDDLHQQVGENLTDHYCCLGVYAHMCGISHANMHQKNNNKSVNLAETFGLKGSVIDMLSNNAGGQSASSTLALQNDDGKTFEQIADLITFYCWMEGIEK